MTGQGALRAATSMATSAALAELAKSWTTASGTAIDLEATGGVTIVQRVRSGEVFDVVFLADDLLATLEREGLIVAGSRVAVADSAIAVAVPKGAPRPDLSTGEAVRDALRAAKRIAYSTGPSGSHLKSLLLRWSVVAEIEKRLLQVPPGMPVARIVAAGEADIGIQQMSELVNQPGIDIVGSFPPDIQRITTFAGGIGARCRRVDEAAAWLRDLASPGRAAVKRRYGLESPA